jgi:hypothetical protein
VDLGTVVVGSSGPLVTVSVANIGNGKARVATHLSDASDFTIQDGCAGSQLAPQEHCSLGISFNPKSAGTLDATLTLSVDNGTAPQPVLLTGIGKAPPTNPPTAPTTIRPTALTGLIKGIYGLCVDDLSSTTTNGNPIIVWQCTGTPNQEWTVGTDGTLRVLGKCMDIAGASSADFTPIDLYDCNGGANQVWQHQPNGEIVNPQSGKCLDDNGSGDAGTHLILYTCGATPNQIWTLP